VYAARGGRHNAGEATLIVTGTRLHLKAVVARVVGKLGPPRFDLDEHNGRYFERFETFTRKRYRARYASAATLEDSICRAPFVDLESQTYSDDDNEHQTRRAPASGQIYASFALLKAARLVTGIRPCRREYRHGVDMRLS
jgi:hypothetical protein